jgi:NADP-dependent 3-hydroxy acid dehydrogenase YdfG
MAAGLVNQAGRPMRLLVVGASSGIGAAIAAASTKAGAEVVGMARRAERIADLDGVIPVACDVMEADSCAQAVATAVVLLGGIDALVYASGTTRLTPLDRTDGDQWAELFATNVTGAALVTRWALAHLSEGGSDGRALYLSSDSAVRPYPGLVGYGASKAALSAFCQGLKNECPKLLVSEVVVGPTVDTEVGTHFDTEEFGHWFERWCDEGFVRYGYQVSTDVASVVLHTLRAMSPPPMVMAAASPDGEAHVNGKSERPGVDADPPQSM